MIRKAADFSFAEVKQGDIVKQVITAPTHEQCTAASCSCRSTNYVKVFSKGPWPGLRPGVSNGEEKCIWGIWGTTPEEAEEKWEKVDKGEMKPCSEGGCLRYCNTNTRDYLEILITCDRVILVLEDL